MKKPITLIIMDGFGLSKSTAAGDNAIAAAKKTKNSCKVCVKVDPTAPDYPYNKQD